MLSVFHSKLVVVLSCRVFPLIFVRSAKVGLQMPIYVAVF